MRRSSAGLGWNGAAWFSGEMPARSKFQRQRIWPDTVGRPSVVAYAFANASAGVARTGEYRSLPGRTSRLGEKSYTAICLYNCMIMQFHEA